MPLASWFSSIRHSRRRQIQTGARSRWRSFRRGVSWEALEDRCLLASVSFGIGGETVDESAGTFSIPVTLSGGVSTFVSGFGNPIDLAVDSHGNLFITDEASFSVFEVPPTGPAQTFASGFNGPYGLAFDPNGNLYVANEIGGSVTMVTPAGSKSTYASVDGPTGLAFDRHGNLYVSQAVDGTVSVVTAGGHVRTFASGFGLPDGLAVDSAGNLYVADPGNSSVIKVTPDGTKTTFVSGAGINGPTGLAFDATGNLYVANAGDNNVIEVSAAGMVLQTIPLPSDALDGPEGLAFDATGNLYIANRGSTTVTEVAPSVAVPFTLGGTAVPNHAVSGVTASPLVIGIGQTTQNITGTLLTDPGPTQTLTLTLDTPNRAAGLGSPSVNTLSITEPAVVQFSAGSETASQHTGTFSIPVTLSGTSTQPVTVPFTLTGTASAGIDYSGLTASPLTFTAGQTTQTITGTLLADPGPNQTLRFTLGTPMGDAVLGSSAVNTLTITQSPGVEFDIGSENVNESAGTFSIPVTLAGTGTQTVSTFASGFNDSVALAVDSANNVYVATTGDNTVSKVTPAGVVSTFASGFDGPYALAFDSAGNLYVANGLDNTVSKVTPAGVVSTFASGFDFPEGLAFDSAGNLYVANNGNGTVSKVSPGGMVQPNPFASGLEQPSGLALDSSGNLYVSLANDTVSEVTPTGFVVTFASGFGGPASLAFDSAGNLYVANERGIGVSEVTPERAVSTFVSGFEGAAGLAFDSAGNLYVATIGQSTTVSKVSETVTVPFALSGSAVAGTAFSGVTAGPLRFGIGFFTQTITGTLLSDPGPSESLIFTLGTPTGGAVLVGSSVNTLTIGEPAGVQFSTGSETVSASTGTFSIPVTLTGGPSVSTFASGLSGPIGMAFDSAGNLYVANDGNNSNTVSEVTPAGMVSTFATGVNDPSGLAFDSAGNLYVTNTSRNTVSLVTRGGAVTTFASGPDVSRPEGLAFDAHGNLYIANDGNNTVSVVTAAGMVSTFASGFKDPFGLAFDSAGNLYVANSSSGTVSKVTPGGIVSTFATGFDIPTGLAFDSAGNLFVVNDRGDTVSEVTPAGLVSTFATGFVTPIGLAFDTGTLYVTDIGTNAVDTVSETVTVPFALGGTAVAGTDFSGVTASPLAFGIGQTTQTITGTLLSDPGTSQTLTLTLGTPTGGAALGSSAVNTLTITERPTVQFSTGSETVNQSTGTFSIPVTLSGTSTQTVTVPFTLAGTAVAGTDYSGVSASPLSFAVGQTTESITGRLLSDPGPTQTLTLTLGAPTGAAVGSFAVNTLTITEPPTVQFSTGSETVNQSTGTFSIPITLSGTSTQTVTVSFTLAGSAVAGADYSGVTAGPLTFAVGQTTENITGTLLADPGPSRTLTLTLGPPTGAVLGSSAVNTLTITEPAPAPAPTFKSAMGVATGTGKKKMYGDALVFSAPLDASSAQNPVHYHVTEALSKKKTKTIPVRMATYNAASRSVTLVLGSKKPPKGLSVTVSGLLGSAGQLIAAFTTKL